MATRADVARLAGVSPATVSYAISGKAPISDETRERVFAAMQQLNYTPHVMAQALAGRRSRILAMLLPSQERALSNNDMEYMLGAASAALELGYRLLLWPTVDRDVEEVVALGQSGLLDGVILMEVRLDDERVGLLRAAGVPFSLIGRTADEEAEPLFSDRDFEGAVLKAVEHLAALGHEHIAFINAPRRLVRRGIGALVRADAGFKAAVKQCGVHGVHLYCDVTLQAGRALAHDLLAKHPQVTAIVEMNSEALIGFMQEASRAGIDIPRRLSVVSANIPEALADATVPAVTTISPPATSMGRTASQLLIASLEGREEPDVQRLFAGDLVDRGTTAPPPRQR